MDHSASLEQKASVKAYLIQIGLLIFILLFSVLTYTFFHEGGHALVGVLFGANITSFSVDFIGMSAHVGLDAAFTPFQQALVSMAGFMTPYLLVVVLLLCLPRRGDAVLEYFKILISVVTISSLLAWVILPWVYLAGARPGDDSITFLANTGIYPPLVSVGVGLLFGLGLAVLIRQTEGLKGIWSRMQASPAEFFTPAARRTLAVLVLAFAVVAAAAFSLGAVFSTSTLDFMNPPADYTQAAIIQLVEHGLDAEPVYTFTLDQPASVSLFFGVTGLTRGPAKIALSGPEGYSSIFFTAGEESSGNFVVNPSDLELAAGQYQIMLTFPQDPGVVVISLKIVPE